MGGISEVAGGAEARLHFESCALIDRIVELAEGVGQLSSGNDQLESLDETWIRAMAAGERAHLGRVVEHEGRIPQLGFDALLVESCNTAPGPRSGATSTPISAAT